MPRKGNYPAQYEPKLEPGQLTTEIGFATKLSDWEFTSDPDKVQERINWFFGQCAAADVRPTVALLAVALNTSRQTMWNWEQRGGRLGEIIGQAKRILNALLEGWSINGRVNPATACWLQKNHFLYKDEISLVSAMPSPSPVTITAEEARAALYASDGYDMIEAEAEQADSNEDY